MMQPRLVILGLIGLTAVGMCHAQGRIMGGGRGRHSHDLHRLLAGGQCPCVRR